MSKARSKATSNPPSVGNPLSTSEPLSANAITAKLLLAIPKRWPDSRVWRANVLVARTRDERIVRAGRPGQADLTGIIKVAGLGVRLEVEVKAGRDRLSENQVLFGAMIQRMGGIYIIAKSVEQALEHIEICVRGIEERVPLATAFTGIHGETECKS